MMVVVAALIAVGISVLGTNDDRPTPDHPAPAANITEVGALPPLPKSPFLNTREGEYVGSAKCRECHESEHAGYRHTGMGQSLATLDPEKEPPDATVDHPESGRRYEVLRRDGRMVHRELLMTSDSTAEVVGEYAISHVIGSGRHSRSYLLEIDGFLVESPVTWYESRQAWDMSPGYDVRYQQGFQRPVDQGCLYCHAGMSRALDGTLHRMEIQEEWLSCERCHGPGSLHVAKQEGNGNAAATKGGIDYSIVNPSHLSRELSVDICAQCHLRSTASISVRGRELDEYRPGLPMDAFRTDYRLDVPASEMTVVGHVEQLRLSRCFENSQMTCVTCHNPHSIPRGTVRTAYYRSKCLTCHQTDQCGVDPAERAQVSADNDCVVCHMPSSPTDIPHLAFTHHRIGLHVRHEGSASAAESVVLDRAVDLLPLSEFPNQSAADRARSLGGAYLELSQREEGLPFRAEYQRRAYRLMLEAWNAGLREPTLAAHLAHLATIFQQPGAVEYAKFVLEDTRSSKRIRINALLAMAHWHSRHGNFDEATEMVREVTGIRRSAADWALVGQFQQRRDQEASAIEALEKSLAIDPTQVELRRQLIEHCRRQGDKEREQWHRQRLPRAAR